VGEHAEVAGGLPAHHRDPFDRVLVAQAGIEHLTLVIRDRAFWPYSVSTLACWSPAGSSAAAATIGRWL